jgi:hypothetical protein
MLTVAHLWYDEDSTPCADDSDIRGNDAKVKGTKIGEVQYADVVQDYAVVEKTNSDWSFENRIDENTGGYPVCEGYVSESQLESWAAQSDYPFIFPTPCLYQMGMTTGRTQGRIDGAHYYDAANPCVSFIDDGEAHGVSTTVDFGKGDSGGPTYHMKDGKAYLVSATSLYYWAFGSSCGNEVGNDSAGIAGYNIMYDLLYNSIG